MIRKLTTYEDIYAATCIMKGFEYASSHIKVNIDFAAKQYFKMVNDGYAVFFALYREGEIIGGLGALKCPDIHTGDLIAVETFWYIKPEERGQGLRLFNEFERWGIAQGCVKLAMIHMEDSYPAALEKLYLRKGYKLVERHYVREIKP